MTPLFFFAIFLSFCFIFFWGYAVFLLRKLARKEQEAIRLENALREIKEETVTLKEELFKTKETLSQKEKELGALREKQKEGSRLFAIFESMPEGIVLLDRQEKIIFLNSRAEKVLGISRAQAQGKIFRELKEFPKILRLQEFLGDVGMLISRDFSLEDNFYVSVTSVPLRAESGYPGVLLVIRDITRERQIERIKTEFVALAAHQLRTPLSAMKWTTQMLLEGDLGKLTKEQIDIIRKSNKSIERMIRLVNSLLEVARIEEGRYLFQLTPVSLESLVESTVGTFQMEARQKGVRLLFQKPKGPLPKAKIDAEKMRLVISNLIDNAIRYTPNGGEVTVSLKYDTKGIECDVQDTGIGIPQNQQGRVFERFFRGANAIRLDTEGTGLGLYITKNIVEAHRGKIWFTSEENKGSTFSFWLPQGE
jgi:PAS domain S-box-containing protein